MYRAFRYRFYPTPSQEVLLRKTMGCSRFVYNHFLALRIKEWTTNQKSVSYNETSNLLTLLKKEEETKWLNEVSSVTLQQSLQNLQEAYNNFFKGLKKKQKVGFPRFKKKSNRNSITLTKSGFSYKNGEIFIAKSKKKLNIRWSRQLPSEDISSIAISLTPSNKWFISILVEDKNDYTLPLCNKVLGVDLGIETFATLSTGEKVKMPDLKPHYEKLKKLQKKHSKKKGIKNKNKARIKVARQHEKISNIRQDFHHKLSTRVINENQVIVLEDLNVSGMVRNRKLARAISQQGWYQFVTFLKYKATMYGREIIQVNRFYPSSKTCSSCGIVQSSLPLHIREWTCDACGTTHDRDINAAKNLMALGTSVTAFGEDVRPTCRQSSVKKESAIAVVQLVLFYEPSNGQ
jgi:putative transposase